MNTPQIKDMTLRDWFAGQAMANKFTHDTTPYLVAKWAYCIADAMMKARDRKENDTTPDSKHK